MPNQSIESKTSTEPSVWTSTVVTFVSASETTWDGLPNSTGKTMLKSEDPLASTGTGPDADVDLVSLKGRLILLKPTPHSFPGLLLPAPRRRGDDDPSAPADSDASQSSANASFLASRSPFRSRSSCSTILRGRRSPTPKKTNSAHFQRKGLMATTKTNQ